MIEIRQRRIIVDGRPAVVMAGEIHYFRVPADQWQQRLDLAAEIGCTAIASYIPWLWHELSDGTIDVTGASRPERDLGAFIDLCASNGFHFIARPGPFIMAELKNEGLPYRLYTEHPEIVGRGWDGAVPTSSSVDYLAPAYLAECRRWYDAVLPVIAERLNPHGPVIAMQLDNEIGMLAWVTNTPDLTDGALDDFETFCRERHGSRFGSIYPMGQPESGAWATVVRSPDDRWAGDLRVDLALFTRERYGRYTAALADMARANGIDGIPFLINIHGTEGGNGVPFGIGVSQLLDTFSGVPGVIAGSDHYLGDMTLSTTTDIHFINAIQAAVNDADQPLTSLEFEAGNGDYGGGLDLNYDPATVDLKTRLCLAQGNRMINYYLLAGGVNPRLEEPVGDGNDRISFTGERHGTAAPIGPEGQRGSTFTATRDICTAVRLHQDWLADMDEEHDDLAMAFLPDAFATEYHHPGSPAMTEIVEDLAAHRGPGQRKALWRSLLFAGYRFGAVNLQDRRAPLPLLIALAGGVHLDRTVQQRLVDHITRGGRLLMMGPLPQRDLRGRACTTLIDALGVVGGEIRWGTNRYYPSITGMGRCDTIPETRVGWLQSLVPSGARPVLVDADGNTCGVEARVGTGRAVLLAAEMPSHPRFFTELATDLGVRPGLTLESDIPGVVVTTTASRSGDRLLHLLNPTGYQAEVGIVEPTGWGGYRVPAHTGHLLARGLRTPWGRIEFATSEMYFLGHRSVGFGPSLWPRGHQVVLETDRSVTAAGADVTRDGNRVTVDGAGTEAGLHIELT